MGATGIAIATAAIGVERRGKIIVFDRATRRIVGVAALRFDVHDLMAGVEGFGGGVDEGLEGGVKGEPGTACDTWGRR